MLQWLQQLIDFILRLLGLKPDTTQDLATPPKPTLEPSIPPEYRKTNSLMTFQERKFYRTVLMKELSSQYAIYPKVRLADLIWIANEPTDKKFHSNQIQCKHIDFVLCNRSTLEPVLALELDDSSHQKYDRRESDEVKDRVCAQARLPLLRVKVQYDYAAEAIAEEIHNMISSVVNA
jgi:hypothetical protein